MGAPFSSKFQLSRQPAVSAALRAYDDALTRIDQLRALRELAFAREAQTIIDQAANRRTAWRYGLPR